MESSLSLPRFDHNDVVDEVSDGNCKAVKNDNKTKTDDCYPTRHSFATLMFTKLSMI